MGDCPKCGKPVVTGEAFCSNCGSEHTAASPSTANDAKESKGAAEKSSGAAAPASPDSPRSPQAVANSSEREFISSGSIGGTPTGELPIQVKHTTKKGSTGGHQATIKQLDPGSVLNTRYEIVRRIGGGGMGAVYLAKDRNLGDAPRAVKEMVEAHLDPTQHEKAIGDFKRESLLLTSLEHPSIPTIYDYFYDEPLGRFYLVMKFISGGDLATRLRTAPGGRIDEKTVADWGMQAADVLEYLHSRPKPIIY
nr:protein kinase [Acidobacteriota bacterium]